MFLRGGKDKKSCEKNLKLIKNLYQINQKNLKVSLHQNGRIRAFTNLYFPVIRARENTGQLRLGSSSTNPVGIYLFKVNKRNTRTMCEICSNLTIKTQERRHWRHWSRSGVFIVNFEQTSHIVLVFLLLTLNK